MNTTPEQHFSLPSPITELKDELFVEKGVQVLLKRDDLIHPVISGNKWRKLKYNIERAQQQGYDTLLTFGGPFSNHIAATAEAGRRFGFKTIGMIRGELPSEGNPTLDRALECGMELHPMDRQTYREKQERYTIETLRDRFGSFYLIPEGGANHLGVAGCMEILPEVESGYTDVAVACGTGTTLAGLVLSLPEQVRLHAFVVFKDQNEGEELKGDVHQLLMNTCLDEELAADLGKKITWHTQFHEGGFAKVSDRQFEFMQVFYQKHQVRLDPLYTGKLLMGIHQLIGEEYFENGTRLLVLHSGGLQGIAGMEQRLGKQFYPSGE